VITLLSFKQIPFSLRRLRERRMVHEKDVERRGSEKKLVLVKKTVAFKRGSHETAAQNEAPQLYTEHSN
jgi:hypothetical protein